MLATAERVVTIALTTTLYIMCVCVFVYVCVCVVSLLNWEYYANLDYASLDVEGGLTRAQVHVMALNMGSD